MSEKANSKKILQVENLSSYFFSKLDELNKKSLCPLPQETLFYSSTLLEDYSLSDKYFNVSDEGRVREKILGTMFLEANQKGKEEQKRIYKDIADTSLMVSGYFRDSINKKIIDKNYYSELGKLSYLKLNQLEPRVMNTTQFYKLLSLFFETLSSMMALMAKGDKSDPLKHMMLFEENSKDESRDLYVLGINPNYSKKVS